MTSALGASENLAASASEEFALTEDQRDAVQEVANIAMGKAAASLAQLFGTFVALSVPRVRVIAAGEFPEMLSAIAGAHGKVTAVRQSFQGEAGGEAMVVLDAAGVAGLSDLMGYEPAQGPLDPAAERELLFDVANLLIGACVCTILEQLGDSPTFSRPSMIADDIPVDYMLRPSAVPWSVAMLVEVKFNLEKRGCRAHLLVLMPEDSIRRMKRLLDELVARS